MSKSDIPAAVPKSRCPPSPTPPPSWITPVSRQSRPTVLEFTGQCGQYRIEGSNIQETRDLLQTVLHTESQHVQHVQHMQFQQMLTLSQNMMFSNALGIQPSSFRAPIVDRDDRMDGSNVVSGLGSHSALPSDTVERQNRSSQVALPLVTDDRQNQITSNDRVDRVRPTVTADLPRDGTVRVPLTSESDQQDRVRASMFIDQPSVSVAPIPRWGLFVHCLHDHHGHKKTFTSDRRLPGPRPKVTTRIGRPPLTVEIIEFLHPQSDQISFWTLPTTATFCCDCITLEQPEKSPWWFLYQCMGRIREELYQDPYRIKNAYETGALTLAVDKWTPSLTYFQQQYSFRTIDSIALLKQQLMTDHMQILKDEYSAKFEKFSLIIHSALEVLISTLLLHSEVWAFVECIDLLFDHQNQSLVAIVARLEPVVFTQEPEIPAAEYICYAHNTNPQSAADSLFHGYIRPSSTDPQDETWIPALTFFCRGVTVARPVMTRSVMLTTLRKAQKYSNFTTDRPTCLLGMSKSRQPHVTNVLGGVIGEHACTHYFDSVHGRDKRWGLRSHLSPLSHLACIIPSS